LFAFDAGSCGCKGIGIASGDATEIAIPSPTLRQHMWENGTFFLGQQALVTVVVGEALGIGSHWIHGVPRFVE
jgi:hypothetical protein